MKDKWLSERILHIKNLKSPSDQQRLLLMLSEKIPRTSDEERKLSFLIKAEWAEAKAQKARSDVARIVNAEKESARKARDRELYQAAGLLILAGLVDTKTGSPLIDRGELLGALIGVEETSVTDAVRTEWKRTGDALLASRERPRKN
ncbi:conjugal transfer protein TraD [Pseudomonas sp. ME-P-057]|uniref:conjugal transfer protein TraD n=1 Tax=Pseudomonas sp. ME-P-057 TaxID=3040321 RepID=UPI0025574D84|nr:conjugal transfer protein TraD [Pseudomonas sp. ME-P-057]